MNRHFADRKNGLIWQKYDLRNGQKFVKQNDVLDSWSSDTEIKKYINNCMSISAKFTAMLGEYNGLYYAFEKKNLVGACVVTTANRGYDVVTIEYIVVDPMHKNSGIATRMVASIQQNPKMFSGQYFGKIDAFVEVSNKPSQRVFLKNKFKVYNRPEDMEILRGYYRMYYDERIKD